MVDQIILERLKFDPEFLYATDGNGSEIPFTRAERALLIALSNKPGVVLPRTILLDAISGAEADTSDRNVDFVINRLRRKLNDSASSPKYIATQYGEGYWWIPQDRKPKKTTALAFLVVGPIQGLPSGDAQSKRGWIFAEEIRAALDRQTASDLRIELDEKCPTPDKFDGNKPEFSVELDFLPISGRVDCAVTLKSFASGKVLSASRATAVPDSVMEETDDQIAMLVENITAAIWSETAHNSNAPVTPRDEPLSVRMHQAATLLAKNTAWKENEQRLRVTLEKSPSNHQAQLMLATAIHSKYVAGGPKMHLGPDTRSQDEREIETLIMSSVPHVQDNPILVLAAAKLLYFVGRGHERLAIELAEKAFAQSTAFATSFATIGQMRMFEGEIEEAIQLFDKGIALTQPGSKFHLYLLFLKCQAALAAAQSENVAKILDETSKIDPKAGRIMAMFTSAGTPNGPSMRLKLIVAVIPKRKAASYVRYMHYITGRLFKSEWHCLNYLRPVVTLLANGKGFDFVPEDIRASVPTLFE